MKATLFDNEIEGYTRKSNAKYIILGTVIFALGIFLLWAGLTLTGISEVMIQIV